MELRVLSYFVEVANEGNITRAAENLHITQPTLSRQLRQLENEVGKQLFQRNPHDITLTEHGLFLYRRALEILALEKSTLKELSEEERYAGEILIAAGDTTAVRHLAKVMKAVHKSHPEIKYSVTSLDGIDAMRYVDRRLVDFALVVGNIDKEKYSGLQLPFEEIWGLLIRKDDPLAKEKHITPHHMEHLPLLWGRQCGNYSDLDGWLGFPSEQLNVLCTGNLIHNATVLAEEGLGSTIAFKDLVYTGEGSSLCFRPFHPEIRARNALIWRKDAVFSRQTQFFLNCFREYVRVYCENQKLPTPP